MPAPRRCEHDSSGNLWQTSFYLFYFSYRAAAYMCPRAPSEWPKQLHYYTLVQRPPHITLSLSSFLSLASSTCLYMHESILCGSPKYIIYVTRTCIHHTSPAIYYYVYNIIYTINPSHTVKLSTVESSIYRIYHILSRLSRSPYRFHDASVHTVDAPYTA